MEIIIHGKPNAGSSKSTFPSDALSQKIVDDFFNRRDDFVEKEALIVEARNWKGVWYSVYTYRLSNLREFSDSVGRSTYFAISLIIQDGYCCLVSEVLALLKKVYNETIVGTYISNQGKYIVQNLDDDVVLNRVLKSVEENYTNLVETFDDKFIPQSEFKNENHYNILDCDSKAFVQCLRERGRIIVSETEKSKDDKLLNVDEYVSLYNKIKSELSEKDSKIGNLQSKIKELEEVVSLTNSSAIKRIKKLEERIEILSKENQALMVEKEKIISAYNAVCDKLNKVAALLGFTGNTHNYNREEKTEERGKSIFPFVNTLLILGLMIFLAFEFIGGDENDTNAINLVAEKQEEINCLSDLIKEKDEEIQSLGMNLEELRKQNERLVSEANTPSERIVPSSRDMDCEIVIYQDNRPTDASAVDISKPITIVIKKPNDEYAFHSDNLKDPTQLKLKNGTTGEIILEPKDSQKRILITYRSSKLSNLNDRNRMEFKTNN